MEGSAHSSTEHQQYRHVTVLGAAVVTHLEVVRGGSYLDATVGGGGHTEALLQAGAERVVALDRDPQALVAAQQRLQTQGTGGNRTPMVTFHHANFAEFQPVELFDGIVADLGVSSPQLDAEERGFSFRQTAPLDMRMDSTAAGPTAADWVNFRDLEELIRIFSEYGEEPFSKRIARQIVARRPFTTTTELAEAIAAAVPPKARFGRIHPATRVFQALRIAVNRELDALDTFLMRSPNWLRPGGRLAIISFHSLEDRRVKWAFRRDDRLQIVTRKPLQAEAAEVAANPRSRSAKLRVAARLADIAGTELSNDKLSG
jgi:16S rRNA (cytosine1402-N4)-methyltransferase